MLLLFVLQFHALTDPFRKGSKLKDQRTIVCGFVVTIREENNVVVSGREPNTGHREY